MPYDPFADLSDAESHFENAAGGGPADMACSLDAANGHDTVVLDDSEGDTALDKCKAAGAKTHTSKNKKVLKRKRTAAQPTSNRRRPYDADKHLLLNKISEAVVELVRCVFLPTKKGLEPLALWPQFTAAWRGVNFGNRTWIVLSAKSMWFA